MAELTLAIVGRMRVPTNGDMDTSMQGMPLWRCET